ncbi:helix-turn-helix domain-containing protein [Oscillibacter sp.]|uniref:helix-turn-helix domain-containing protein n=1 Tax=Oscillibacter sp. TaxID=1945593 RepID=UPI0021735D5E|nr:helix-turn-helix transcriptional regulator [Oscillibacter sp.]MCI9241516.1 helix-turn-helix transcriptional regulator [Oscillibacter sp.]
MHERLRKLRKDHGISQRALAELLGISQQTYSRYERGQRNPSVETAYVLARLYHVSMDYLAGITDDPQPRW